MSLVSKAVASRLMMCCLIAGPLAAVVQAQSKQAPSKNSAKPAADKPTLLRWKFAKGQRLQYLMVQDMTTAVSALSTTATLDMDWQVESVDEDGTATINYTLDRVRMNVKAGAQPAMEADSQNDDAESELAKRMKPIFEATIGKTGSLVISPQGKIDEVQLPPGMADKLKSAPALGAMAGMLNEAFFKQMIKSAGLELPEKAVAPGQTWTQSQEIKLPVFGRQAVKTTYRFDGVESRGGRTLAKISPDVEVTLPDADKSMEIGEQESSGTIYFDTSAGKITQLDVEHSVQLNVPFMGQKFTEEVGTVASLKLISSGGDDDSSAGVEPALPTGDQPKAIKKKPK
ncbi:MAG TPA: DUF6263 family protein [Pirellulales bacterium]